MLRAPICGMSGCFRDGLCPMPTRLVLRPSEVWNNSLRFKAIQEKV